MLGERVTQGARRKTYLNIKGGAIVKRTPQGEESYAYVDGRLERITTKQREFHGETVTYWYLDIRDVENGELYSLGFPWASNTFKSIILQLASETGLECVKRGSTLRIEPYTRNGYDKVQVWGEGIKLDWATKDLPPVTERVIGGRKVKDDTQRMNLIETLARSVASHLQAPARTEAVQSERN